jgi:uncharacterized repeat protein (TIGR01451 family)
LNHKCPAIAVVVFLIFVPLASAQSAYTTGFESPQFTLGDVAGQDTWGHIDNSPTRGEVVAAPMASPSVLGAQSLALLTWKAENFWVSNHLYSARISSPAGESGSRIRDVAVVDPQSHFEATLWVRTPSTPVIPSRTNGRFAQLNPSSKGPGDDHPADRYASVQLYNPTRDDSGTVEVRMTWPTAVGVYKTVVVASLEWGEWYRFEYLIHLVDGLDDDGLPNDRFTLTIYDAAGDLVGSACGSTWEIGWRFESWSPYKSALAINGFDFWSDTAPNGTLVAHLDGMAMRSFTPSNELSVEIEGGGTCLSAATLVAKATVGGGKILSYTWKDADGNVVGTEPTLTALPGTYTVTVTDELCVTAISAPVSVFAFLQVAISGATSVRWDQTTPLVADVSGGSGSITSYQWRNYYGEIVGTGATLDAEFGIYTVTVVDAACGMSSSASFQVNAEWTPNILISKDLLTEGPYFEGQSLDYLIYIANQGPGPATSVTVTDTPLNLTITSVSGNGCNAFPCTMTTFGEGYPFGPGASAIIMVTATIDAPGPFDNSAAVSAPELDLIPEDNEDTTGNGGVAAGLADLSIQSTLTSAGPFFQSLPVTYRIVVGNAGPRDATSLLISATWGNLTVASVGGACSAFPCTIDNLAAGSTAVIEVEAIVEAPGQFIKEVSVSSNEADLDPTNNIAIVEEGPAEEAAAIPFTSATGLLLLALAMAIAGGLVIRT